MFELLVVLTFIVTLWIFGRSLLLACSAREYGWLATPLGLCLVGLAGNMLYFGGDVTVQTLQWLFVASWLPCLVYVLRRGVPRREWFRLLAVCGMFLLLALPAFLGGEQYYVMRGNHWDHFNYINQALALWAHPYSSYQHASVDSLVRNDVLFYGTQFIGARPAVGLVLALMLPAGTGNVHLLAFLYVTALWALAYPAMAFAWERILEVSGRRPAGSWLLLAPPVAYIVGFWGQYSFDINAWSQMASLSLLASLVFAYLRLLHRLSDPSGGRDNSATADYLVTGVLAAGGFLFYPENAVLHVAFLFAATIAWFVVSRTLPRPTAVGALSALSLAAVLLSSLPHWEGTVGLIRAQVTFQTAQAPEWWRYFDRYWLGIHGIASGGAAVPSAAINLVLAVMGVYFATPDYSLPIVMRAVWMIFAGLLAALAVYSLFVTLVVRFGVNRTAVFLRTFVIANGVFLLYLLQRNQLWALGKGLSYWSPYVFLVLCLGLVHTPPAGVRALGDKAVRGFVILFIASQLAFGAARLWAAGGADGIGFSNASYPSIQGTEMKTAYAWDVDPRVYAHCRGVHLSYSDTDTGQENVDFYLHYMKQKLFYLGVPYFSSRPIRTHFAAGTYVGDQPPIATDCRAVIMAGVDGKRRAIAQ